MKYDAQHVIWRNWRCLSADETLSRLQAGSVCFLKQFSASEQVNIFDQTSSLNLARQLCFKSTVFFFDSYVGTIKCRKVVINAFYCKTFTLFSKNHNFKTMISNRNIWWNGKRPRFLPGEALELTCMPHWQSGPLINSRACTWVRVWLRAKTNFSDFAITRSGKCIQRVCRTN